MMRKTFFGDEQERNRPIHAEGLDTVKEGTVLSSEATLQPAATPAAPVAVDPNFIESTNSPPASI